MSIDQEYLNLLLTPLDNSGVLSITTYIKEIQGLGIDVESEDFARHLKYLCLKKEITNFYGKSDHKNLGFNFTASGKLSSVVGHIEIMKAGKEEKTMAQNFNIGTLNAQSAQLGNGNTQNVTINMQELVEKVAASGDKEAKSALMKALENPIVSKVIGAAVPALIGLLSL
jgi:hypothetical protein